MSAAGSGRAWMVVSQASPLRVRGRGETGAGVEATSASGASFTVGQRVLVDVVGTETVVLNAYATPAAAAASEFYLRSPNGTLFKITVSNDGGLAVGPA